MDISGNYLCYLTVAVPPAKTFFLSPLFPSGPFRVEGIGYREAMPPCLIDRPSGTNNHLIMLFQTAARAGSSVDAPLRPGGHLFIWNPGVRQYYGNPRKRYLHSWIHCRGPLVEALVGGEGVPCLRPLTQLAAPFLAFLRNLHREISGERPDAVIAANLFENWARDAARRLRRPGALAPAPLRAVREYLDREYARPIFLADMARLARLSPSHFSAEFRRHFGVPPVGYLIRRRLHHAAYLLQDVNLSVAEAGQRVGYDDLFYFSKLFKRFHGASPRAWRERSRL